MHLLYSIVAIHCSAPDFKLRRYVTDTVCVSVETEKHEDLAECRFSLSDLFSYKHWSSWMTNPGTDPAMFISVILSLTNKASP